MPTVHEEAGCTIKINTNDHLPPHVHVYVGGGIVQFLLNDDISIKQSWHVSVSDLKKARRVTLNNRGKLLKEWSKIHGKA